MAATTPASPKRQRRMQPAGRPSHSSSHSDSDDAHDDRHMPASSAKVCAAGRAVRTPFRTRSPVGWLTHTHSHSHSHSQDNGGLGSIEKIELVNFMCHSYLQVSLGSKINFIVGHNGSGKSAILTALTVCLGGKASFTNRGNNIRALLKEGEQVGSVTIHIRNCGPDAYKPKIYGSTIIVERKIVREGTATYKIKNAKGGTVSTRHEDLISICDHMQIVVDNPMAILTQDTARTLLANSSAQEKYNFFLKGTQLEKLTADYVAIDEFIENSTKILSFKKTALPDMEQDVARLEKKWKDMEVAMQMEKDRNRIFLEHIWAKIQEFEQKIETEEELLERQQLKLEANAPRIAEAERDVEACSTQVAQLTEQLHDVRAEMVPVTAEREKLHREIQESKQLNAQLSNDITSLDRDLRKYNSAAERLDARIAEEKRKLQVDHVAVREQKRATIVELQENKNQLNHDRDSWLVKRDELEASQSETREMRERAVEQLTSSQNRMHQMQDQLRRMESNKSDRLAMFGDRMPEIVRQINEQDRRGAWRGARPVGPIGMYVNLERPEFTDVIEHLVAATMSAMIVETHEDLKLLQSIAQRCGFPNMDILKVDGRSAINISSGLPDPSYTTVLSCLKIENPVVLKALVITHSIEKLVLVNTRDEGDELARHGYPRNVNGVYTKDCYAVGTRNGGFSASRLHKAYNAPRMTKNVDNLIAEMRQKTDALARTIELHQQELQRLDQGERQVASERNRIRMAITDIDRKMEMIDRQIYDIEDSLREDDPTNINALEQERAEEADRIRIASAQIHGLTEQRQVQRSLHHEIVARVQQIETTLGDIQNRHYQISNELETASARFMQLTHNLGHFRDKQAEYQAHVTQQTEKVAMMRAKAVEQEARCREQVGPRVPVQSSVAELEHSLKLIEAKLAEKEKQFGSREKLFNELSAKQGSLAQAQLETKHSEAFLRHLRRSLAQRNRAYDDFKTYISIRAKRLFSELIRKRGYRGVLTLDHDRKELMLKVPADNGGNDTDPRALSGGEKSFATVCLLLALWESMASPFRALDEFDVFMDAVNRRLAMKLMISNARDAEVQSQYILITPQNMSHVEGIGGPDVRVCRLSDPERNQQRLSFG
ncbi:hypothetical protein BC831DRAFT_498971 [Entophlyctis helioformis]|nr:hypothetical protein BC831DRAFT_498971 [Entophlyctis helioformis]